jgi:hypothetical protein
MYVALSNMQHLQPASQPAEMVCMHVHGKKHTGWCAQEEPVGVLVQQLLHAGYSPYASKA